MFDCKVSNPSVTLPTPTVSGQDASVWTLTSPNGSRVERYIVEFECRVRNITFVEKYMSVSASGGIGRVAINVSCFGGLGQLYRVKVWAVSGPNISRALVCVTGVQCREEGRRACCEHVMHAYTYTVFHYWFSVSCKRNAHFLYSRFLQYRKIDKKIYSDKFMFLSYSSSNCSHQSNSSNSNNCG